MRTVAHVARGVREVFVTGLKCRGTVGRVGVLLLCLLSASPAFAQTGGEAGIQGTVTDSTGASIPNATVVATNNATGVSTTRQTSGSGLYTISPVIPGVYTVKVTAAGFSDFTQNNFTANALVLTTLNVGMKVGAVGSEVTVNEAPPQLETSNAMLGLTIENETYANLPLSMTGNSQRDPTAFGALAPGAQGGARLPIIGGTGNYLGQLYLDGLPAQTINQQGDNRVVSQAVSVDAIDQLQVITSTPSAEFSGAGAENFTIKSGGRKYHGQVSDFIRNTAFDISGFSVKASTIKNADGTTSPAQTPIDHQNEFSATFGGHFPGVSRLFFFVAYDKYHSRTSANPQSFTIASTLERTGDFTELNCALPANKANTGCVGTGLMGTDKVTNPAILFDPTSNVCTGGICTRQPFQGLKNGVPTNNVISAGYLSPIALAMESFLPAPTNPSSLTSNYTAPLPGGFDNHAIDYRVDFDLSEKHRISTVGAIGTVNYLNNYGAPYLPQPYTGGDLAHIYPKVFDVEDAYTITNAMVNQLKFGFTRFFQNIQNSTQGVSQFSPTTLGITNLPGGQAADEFPGVSFATTSMFGTALQTFTGNGNAVSTQVTTPNNYTLVDNFQYTKGKHSVTVGVQAQWQEINNANPATLTGILSLPFTANSTANFADKSSSLSTSTTGFSYASFLLGAVGGTPSIGINPVSETGGRYHPLAPYIEDTWKVSSKITIDAGLRWDYLPPFHEVKDRWSFLNPTQMNAATGTLGDLQFAGNYGGAGVSCGCRAPIQTYWKNFGPRVGITYSPDTKTVFRVGLGHVFSQGGGVGGRAGAAAGTGQLGFNTLASGPAEVPTGVSAGPSFYLNNGAAFKANGLANTSLFGAGYAYPTAPVPGAASQILNTGNYINPTTGKFVTANGISYADPYFSGRAPDFTFFNGGMERALTNSLTLAVNYVGNQSHHLYNSTSGGGNIRGYWANQLNPIYLAGLGGQTDSSGKNPLLTSPATDLNVQKAKAVMPGINIPAFFQAAAGVSNTPTIAQGLVAFPQYNGVSDTYGVNTGNFTYHSLQVTLQQRLSKGLTFNANYTWSKNIGDDGTFRSGFDIPGAAISGGGRNWHQDRIERSSTVVSTPQSFHAYGVYHLPFGEGHLGGGSYISRLLTGGWQLSGIYTYASGTPVAITSSQCGAAVVQNLIGTCMPDLNPNYATNNARIGGSYGSLPGGQRSACALSGACNSPVATQYFDPSAFQRPQNVSPVLGAPITLIGNSPRTHPLMLTNPGSQNVDTAFRKTFKLREALVLQIEADCLNTWNHTNFSNPNSQVGSATFGAISSVANKPRSFQLAGHFNF